MTSPSRSSRVLLAPDGVREWLADSIRNGGGTVVHTGDDAEILVWAEPAQADALATLLDTDACSVRWVQLPWAGVEPYAEVIRQHGDRTWTCAKGVYAEPVAEHALALLLAGLRNVGKYARADQWSAPAGTNLLHGKVVIVGGGGITESLLRLLEPFHAEVTVVRRHVAPVAHRSGATVVGIDELDRALAGAIGVVLALALTPETDQLMNKARLELIHERGWIVNVARGRHIVTDDLVEVLQEHRIGGAALDVTDPEPLPPDHALWTLGNAIITPHVGNTPEMALPLLADRITDNIRRWIANDPGEPLLGLVDPVLGY